MGSLAFKLPVGLASQRYLHDIKRAWKEQGQLPITAGLSLSGPHGPVQALFQRSSPCQTVLSIEHPPLLSSSGVLVRLSIRGHEWPHGLNQARLMLSPLEFKS